MHHAYLYEGSQSAQEALVASARKLLGFQDVGDPDVHIYVWEKLNIEEARNLSIEASLKPVSGRALFILAAGSISTDAQQALLKLFEEPQAGTTFILLVPKGSLMPTLRSRFAEYPEAVAVAEGSNTFATKFLKSASKDRSAEVTKLLKDEEGVKERVRDFLASLEAVFYKKIKDKEARAALSEIALVRGYVGDRSASLKMLLEHLAAVLPTV
jgi:DNA polymerase III delta prime subunit